MGKENIENYNPFALVFGKNAYKDFFSGERNIEYYDRSWFCEETGNIHHSEKAVLTCSHCRKKYFKLSDKQKKLREIYKKFKKIKTTIIC